jgi:hypothetical protein
MIKARKAYCSATDRNVPVVPKAGARLGRTPSVQDAEILICLDYGVRCTGAMCPLFTPLLVARSGEWEVDPHATRIG